MTLKQRVFKLIDDDNVADSEINKKLSSIIMFLIILSIVAVILESEKTISDAYHSWFVIFEVIAVAIFTLEYFARIYTASLEYPHLSRGRAILKYILSPMAIIDFLAIVPFYIELGMSLMHTGTGMLDLRFIRVLRLMRLLRIFKLNRYNDSMKLIGDVIREEKEKLFITIFITGILLILSSALIFTAEHDVQPEKFPNIYASMWWAIATLTTVGYGDVYPITAIGKILSGFIAILGIGLVALPTGILAGSFVQAINEEKEAKKLAAENLLDPHAHSCPHCGGALEHSHPPG